VANDLDDLLDRLAERLKTIREDAELARSVGYQGISAALDRTQVRLNDLAHSLEALCLQVEQQHANAERFEATAAKGEAESQALKQTVEALSAAATSRNAGRTVPPKAVGTPYWAGDRYPAGWKHRGISRVRAGGQLWFVTRSDGGLAFRGRRYQPEFVDQTENCEHGAQLRVRF
jgi:hypothetical protein